MLVALTLLAATIPAGPGLGWWPVLFIAAAGSAGYACRLRMLAKLGR